MLLTEPGAALYPRLCLLSFHAVTHVWNRCPSILQDPVVGSCGHDFWCGPGQTVPHRCPSQLLLPWPRLTVPGPLTSRRPWPAMLVPVLRLTEGCPPVPACSELCFRRWTVDQRKRSCPSCRKALATDLPGICLRLAHTMEALFPEARAAVLAGERGIAAPLLALAACLREESRPLVWALPEKG